jgi:hypothetical protein
MAILGLVKVGDIVSVKWDIYRRQIPKGARNCFRVVKVEAGLFCQLADMQGSLFLCGATVHRDALELDTFLTDVHRAVESG